MRRILYLRVGLQGSIVGAKYIFGQQVARLYQESTSRAIQRGIVTSTIERRVARYAIRRLSGPDMRMQ